MPTMLTKAIKPASHQPKPMKTPPRMNHKKLPMLRITPPRLNCTASIIS